MLGGFFMTKTELIDKIADKVNVTKADAKKVVDAAIEEIMDAVINGDKVGFAGFGTFYISERAARVGRNPRTGEKLNISAFKLPVFKCGRVFKDKANK